MSGLLSSIGGAFGTIRRLLPDWGWGLICLGLALIWPYMVETSLLDASTNALAYVIMALGLNIVVGFAGLLDLGYVAFYAIGAFVVGWLGSGFFIEVNGGEGIHILAESSRSGLSGNEIPIPGIHVDFWVILVAGAVVTAVWGAILGAPTLRLRGDYLAIVTLAFGEIVPRVFENLEGISNGRQGITPIDRITLVPFFDNKGINYTEDLELVYMVALAMVLIILFINFRLRDSRLGRAWIAVREDEVAAAAMGVNLVRTKLWAYAIGAAMGGFAGVFLGAFKNTVNVDQFEFGFSAFILCMIIIGGMGNIWGVIVGAVTLSMIDRYLLKELNAVPDAIGLDFDVTAINFGIYGFLLVVMMVLRPEGLIPSRRRKLELHEAEIEGPVVAAAVGDMSQAYEVDKQ